VLYTSLRSIAVMSPVKVFICYKKVRAHLDKGEKVREVDSKASALHHVLKGSEGSYVPWMDDRGIGAGVAWETEIYQNIIDSDLLLVLIAKGTSESPWVQREIALARALGISIVPLGYDLSREQLVVELKELGIDQFQGRISNNIDYESSEALLSELRVDLARAAERTKNQQEQTLRGLLDRRNIKPEKAADNQRAATFVLKATHPKLRLHVAAGDISRVRGVDVLVNSENDYMQMARSFESRTVSSTLRRLGESTRNGKYEDAIQHELDCQLGDRSRPVHPAEAFVTSTGGPYSELSRLTRARYIIHVAAVQAVMAEARVIPFKQPEQIEGCVRACLRKVREINDAKGILSHPGSEQRAEQERRAADDDWTVSSVIFPLFGTGQAGAPINEVLGAMLLGMQSYFDDAESQKLADVLTDIYVSAFTKKDAHETIEFLKSRLS
jgi:O-acetyl-ADP-ribose deacetylase (regulator of RNase III)